MKLRTLCVCVSFAFSNLTCNPTKCQLMLVYDALVLGLRQLAEIANVSSLYQMRKQKSQILNKFQVLRSKSGDWRLKCQSSIHHSWWLDDFKKSFSILGLKVEVYQHRQYLVSVFTPQLFLFKSVKLTFSPCLQCWCPVGGF